MGQSLIYLIPIFGIFCIVIYLLEEFWVSAQESWKWEKWQILQRTLLMEQWHFYGLSIECLQFCDCCCDSSRNKWHDRGSSPLVALSFVIGALCSALAGFIGMKVIQKANVRTTNAAKIKFGKAFEVAFAGGSVMGMGCCWTWCPWIRHLIYGVLKYGFGT